MNGMCWRLLAVFSLMFVTPTFLRGQNATADRSLSSDVGAAPLIAPGLLPITYSTFITPVLTPPPNLPRGSPVVVQRPVFQQLVRAAGIIFSGRVTSVGRTSSSSRRQASTAVTFKVERALRGASPGQSLTIHEWAGLWTSGERYHVGEHVLLFLYSPSKLGLTSPVAGALGKFGVDSQGRIMMNAQQAATLAADPVLAGKTGGETVVPYAAFIQAVHRSSREE